MFKCIVRVCSAGFFSTSISTDVKRYVNPILECNYFVSRLHDMPDLDKEIGYILHKYSLVSNLPHVCG